MGREQRSDASSERAVQLLEPRAVPRKRRRRAPGHFRPRRNVGDGPLGEGLEEKRLGRESLSTCNTNRNCRG